MFEPNAVEKIDINLQRGNREEMQRVKRGMEIGRQRWLRAGRRRRAACWGRGRGGKVVEPWDRPAKEGGTPK